MSATHSSASPSYGVEATRIATALTAVRRRLGGAAYQRAQAAGTLEEAADAARRLLSVSPDQGRR